MCSDPVDPGGEVHTCSVGAYCIRGDEMYRRHEYIIFHKRQLCVRPIEWLKLNFASCLIIRHSLGVLILCFIYNMVIAN